MKWTCFRYILSSYLESTNVYMTFKQVGLSSEGNMTPHQLFAEGMSWAIQLNMPTAASVSSISQNTQANLPDESEAVQIPQVSFVPCQTLSHELHQSVNPLDPCSDYGKQLYSRTIYIVGQHLLTSCNECSHV